MKLGRNDPCWCGSGKKFKRCHLSRGEEPSLPFSAVEHQMRESAATVRGCLHPRAAPGVCNKVISAHTVQRSRVLRRLLDRENHVLTFHPWYAAKATSEPKRVGWRDASTIPGFCARHDADTFRDLETGDFAINPRSCFLLGYRALCHEIHSKRAANAAEPVARTLIDRGMPPWAQRQVQTLLDLRHLGIQKGLEGLDLAKKHMDGILLSGELAGICAVALEFDGPLTLATSGTLTPDIDLSGNRLQVLRDLTAKMEWLSISVDATPTGGVVVLSWSSAAEKSALFVESLLAREPDEIISLLPQLILFYLENTYFSLSWWSHLSDELRSHVRDLAQESHPYYSERRFRSVTLVPWRNLRVHRLISL